MLPMMWERKSANKVERERLKNAVQDKIAAVLAQDTLEDIVLQLQTWPEAWQVKDESPRWIAERLVLFLYDIQAKPEGSHFPMNKETLRHFYAESREQRRQFLEFAKFDTAELAPRGLQHGDCDLWTALSAFNAFRFKLLDSLEVWQTAEKLDGAICHIPRGAATQRAMLNKSIRLREHATVGLILAVQPMLKSASPLQRPSYLGITRHSGFLKFREDAAAPLTEMLYICRVALSFLVGFRNLLKSKDHTKYFFYLERLHSWCSTRQPSCLALSASRIDDGSFFTAVYNFEAAIMTEFNAFMSLANCSAGSDKHMQMEMAHLNVCLYTRPCHEKSLKNVRPEDAAYMAEIFSAAPQCLSDFSDMTAVLMRVLVEADAQVADKHKNDHLNTSSAFLTSVPLMETFAQISKEMCPEVFQALKHAQRWDLTNMTTLLQLQTMVTEESVKRLGVITSANTETREMGAMPLSITDLKKLRQKAQALGYE